MKQAKRQKPIPAFGYRFKNVGAGACGCYSPSVRHGDPNRPVSPPKYPSRDRVRLLAKVELWIRQLIVRKNGQYTFFCKEDIAVELRARVADVEVCLRRLNQQGKVKQPQHSPDMDCHRHPWEHMGPSSMWNADRYGVTDKFKEEVLGYEV